MIKEMGTLMMLGSLALQGPALVSQPQTQPTTLSGYIEAANSDTHQPDPIVTTVANLCPVILEAAKGHDNPYSVQMEAACGLLQSSSAPISDDLLALAQ